MAIVSARAAAATAAGAVPGPAARPTAGTPSEAPAGPAPGPAATGGGADRPGRAPAPRDGTAILNRFERAELAGAACALGDLVRELRDPEAARSADEVVSLLDAYHRHLCSAYRACPADGATPVLAFSSFARTARPDRAAAGPA